MMVLDARVLQRLVCEFANARFPLELADRYVDLLPARITRIQSALDAADSERAVECGLSLKAGSATVGALELGELADQLVSHVKRQDFLAARMVAGGLNPAAKRAVRGLAAYVDQARRTLV